MTLHHILSKFRRPKLSCGGSCSLRNKSDMSSFFHGKSHTVAYAKYRPRPPQHLLESILKYVQEKLPAPLRTAVDVGCGSGQSTLYLSPHFQHVLGLEVSSNQLVEARTSAKDVPNVEFKEGVAEAIPIESSTAQLVTASQCIHWFDTEKFYSEVKRVLVPDGVLAVYAHMMPLVKSGNATVDQKLYDHLMQYHLKTLGKYWEPARKIVDNRYNSILLPFKDVQRIEGMWFTKSGSVSDYKGYLTTWSSFQTYSKVNGSEAAEELLSQFIKRLLEILQSSRSEEETSVDLHLEYILLMGRKSHLET